ncbi:DUF4350 domain-containing protein [Lentibacillus salinarum]|uniref:DUF4350 domain-containing protein n=1 Tax=Lentibacillus salinarum TaxID=446820 RepID=A0ABW3ZQU7_9BACI
MQTSVLGRKTLVWLIVVLLVFIAISYFFAPDGPDEYPDFVSESPSPTGVKAFETYLDDQIGTVNRWRHSPDMLPDQDAKQLLIMAEPSFTPGRQEMNDYVSFMEAGNTILLLNTNPDGMFGLDAMPAENDPSNVMDQDGNRYQAENRSVFRIDPSESLNVLLEDNAGAVAAEKTFGNGHLVAAVTPEWVTNDQILKKDHLELLFSLIQMDKNEWDIVYFDEYVHHTGNAPSFTTLYPDWLLALALQAIVFALMVLWYEGKRFGPVTEPREETVRFSDERIRALAAWYQRSRNYADSLRIQADYVKSLLQEHWGIAYYKTWTDISGQLKRNITSDEDIEAFLDGLSHVLHRERISKKQYIVWSKRIDQLRKEVEEA